jgi:hypothetical protein
MRCSFVAATFIRDWAVRTGHVWSTQGINNILLNFVDVIVCLDACPFSNQRLYSMTAEADAKRAIVRKLVEEFKDEGWDKAWSVCTIHDRTA